METEVAGLADLCAVLSAEVLGGLLAAVAKALVLPASLVGVVQVVSTIAFVADVALVHVATSSRSSRSVYAEALVRCAVSASHVVHMEALDATGARPGAMLRAGDAGGWASVVAIADVGLTMFARGEVESVFASLAHQPSPGRTSVTILGNSIWAAASVDDLRLDGEVLDADVSMDELVVVQEGLEVLCQGKLQIRFFQRCHHRVPHDHARCGDSDTADHASAICRIMIRMDS
mmetsp:Transcript_20944/g.45254  ORF Transcript_20944/g.45254 Transcript_20944/m.45254 type:complete len:233 (-) Transcript_20944:640-1338(-)